MVIQSSTLSAFYTHSTKSHSKESTSDSGSILDIFGKLLDDTDDGDSERIGLFLDYDDKGDKKEDIDKSLFVEVPSFLNVICALQPMAREEKPSDIISERSLFLDKEVVIETRNEDLDSNILDVKREVEDHDFDAEGYKKENIESLSDFVDTEIVENFEDPQENDIPDESLMNQELSEESLMNQGPSEESIMNQEFSEESFIVVEEAEFYGDIEKNTKVLVKVQEDKSQDSEPPSRFERLDNLKSDDSSAYQATIVSDSTEEESFNSRVISLGVDMSVSSVKKKDVKPLSNTKDFTVREEQLVFDGILEASDTSDPVIGYPGSDLNIPPEDQVADILRNYEITEEGLFFSIKPEGMGELSIRLCVDENLSSSIEISSDSEEVIKLLEGNVSKLESSIDSTGLNVKSIIFRSLDWNSERRKKERPINGNLYYVVKNRAGFDLDVFM